MLELTPCDAENLIEKHRRELYSFLLRRVSCAETANDLLQDLYLRLVQFKTSEPIQNPRAFVYRIAANLATDHLRKRKETIDLTESEVETVRDDAPGPESRVFGEQQIGLCTQALEGVSPLCLKILILSRFEGLTHKQIAEELGISVSWVEKNIITAMKQCKRALNSPDHR